MLHVHIGGAGRVLLLGGAYFVRLHSAYYV